MFSLCLFGMRGTLDDNRPWLDTIPRFADFGHEQDRPPFNDAVSGFNTAAVCFAALLSAAERRTVRPDRL